MPIKIFLTGATGYIGGAVLYDLLKNKDYHVTALIRAQEKAKLLEAHGVRPVIGGLDDETWKNEVVEADVVIHTANSADHLKSAQTIVEGFRERFKKTGKKGIYLHTSGSGIVSAITRGNYATTEIFDDANQEQIDKIPWTNPHRDVDKLIFDNKDLYDYVIIAPTTIYGISKHLEGVSNPISIQIPVAIQGALRKKRSHQIGKGLNIWSDIHIDDVASLFIVLLEKLLKGELSPELQNGYFFAENGEHTLGSVHQEIARILAKKGIASDTTIAEVNTDEEFVEGYGFKEILYYIGTDSRVKANKGRKLGWVPKHEPGSVLKVIESEVDFLLAHPDKKIGH